LRKVKETARRFRMIRTRYIELALTNQLKQDGAL
jgi:hypothetical protein